MQIDFFNLDIEPTNRCNASCYFCPRDQTPHQGLMTPETFDQALARAVEFEPIARERFGARMKVNLCGLGEPLLNKHTPEFAARIHAAGFECSVSTNGALLDERRGRALLDAGIDGIEINIGEEGDDYEEIYKLPFERTCENVVRFAEMAGDRCQVRVVLVNHRRDPHHIAKMTRFWRERGIKHFLPFQVMNRAGALFVDDMQYARYEERARAAVLFSERGVSPICPAPFVLLFIGYDGQYYLCCSDWKKQVPLGSVFDVSFVDITEQKLAHVESREPICKTCNHDPVNRLTDELRACPDANPSAPDIDSLVDELVAADATARGIADDLRSLVPPAAHGVRPRKLIPLVTE